MTIPHSHRGVLAADVATLATIGADGGPGQSRVVVTIRPLRVNAVNMSG
jgi:hypothetical protein